MELKDLFASSKLHQFEGGGEITFNQIQLGDIPFFVEILAMFFENPQEPTIDKVKKALKNDSEKVYEVLTKLTNLTLEQVKTLNFLGIVFVITHIVKENSDFLQRQVLPQVEEMKKVMAGFTKYKG